MKRDLLDDFHWPAQSFLEIGLEAAPERMALFRTGLHEQVQVAIFASFARANHSNTLTLVTPWRRATARRVSRLAAQCFQRHTAPLRS